MQGKQLSRVITDRDLCSRAIATGQDPKRVRVQECMTGKPVCCATNDTLDYAMRQNQIRRIVVVDGYYRVRGLVSMALR